MSIKSVEDDEGEEEEEEEGVKEIERERETFPHSTHIRTERGCPNGVEGRIVKWRGEGEGGTKV